MSEYYKRVELVEGNPVLFVGVHALRWQREWGEPSVGFIEAGNEIDELNERLKAVKAKLEIIKDEALGGDMDNIYILAGEAITEIEKQ